MEDEFSREKTERRPREFPSPGTNDPWREQRKKQKPLGERLGVFQRIFFIFLFDFQFSVLIDNMEISNLNRRNS